MNKGAKPIAFLTALIVLAAVSTGAAAQSPDRWELTLYTVAEPEPIAGHEGALYYKLCEEFEGCGVNIAYPDADNLARHLAAYALLQDIPGIRCAAADGAAETAALPPALYLAVFSCDGDFTSYLTEIPGTTDGELRHDAAPSAPEQSTGELKVKAVWDTEKPVPESVAVSLLHNGAVTDTVMLCGENNWEYTWRDLEAGGDYTAVELCVPRGYIAGYKLSQGNVVITNTENTVIRCDMRQE